MFKIQYSKIEGRWEDTYWDENCLKPGWVGHIHPKETYRPIPDLNTARRVFDHVLQQNRQEGWGAKYRIVECPNVETQ